MRLDPESDSRCRFPCGAVTTVNAIVEVGRLIDTWSRRRIYMCAYLCFDAMRLDTPPPWISGQSGPTPGRWTDRRLLASLTCLKRSSDDLIQRGSHIAHRTSGVGESMRRLSMRARCRSRSMTPVEADCRRVLREVSSEAVEVLHTKSSIGGIAGEYFFIRSDGHPCS